MLGVVFCFDLGLGLEFSLVSCVRVRVRVGVLVRVLFRVVLRYGLG